MQTQLLCTFAQEHTLDRVIKQILYSYDVAFNTIYVLEDVALPSSLFCTYNINTDSVIREPLPETTISLHRKKLSNTLYTINALNKVIEAENNGKLDKKFTLDWSAYKNCILVTAGPNLRKIDTRVRQIINITEYSK